MTIYSPLPIPTAFHISVAFFLLAAALTKFTFAAPPETVLVITAGEKDDQTLLETNAKLALRNTEVGLAKLEDAELNGFERTATIVCLEQGEECVELVRRAPATWVLLLRLVRESNAPDSDQRVIGTLFSTDNGELLQAKQSVCQKCSSQEKMASDVIRLVNELIDSELADLANDTYLIVTSTPANAILGIDGVVVGPTGQRYQVSPGEHTLTIQADGYQSISKRCTVNANEHKRMGWTLAEIALENNIDNMHNSNKVKTILSWTAIGTGILAVGGGAYWMTVDDNFASMTDRGRKLKNTRSLGYTSAAAGALLIGTGVALLVTGDSFDAEKPTVTATPVDDGLTVALTGHF